MPSAKEVTPAKWKNIRILYDDGWFSAIWGIFEGDSKKVVGVRWNGEGDSKGMPISSAHPVWLVMPNFATQELLVALWNRILAVPTIPGGEEYKQNLAVAQSEFATQLMPNQVQRAVALFGAQNTGKTATLHRLIDLLEKAAGARLIGREPNGDIDCSVCFKYNGFTVAVVTGGDDEEAVERAFEFANRYNGDFLFCACRKYENTLSRTTVNKLTNEQRVHVLYVPRTVEAVVANQDKVNRNQAEELLNIIG